MRVDTLSIVMCGRDREILGCADALATRYRAKGVARVAVYELDGGRLTRVDGGGDRCAEPPDSNAGVYVLSHGNRYFADHYADIAETVALAGLGAARKIVLLACFAAHDDPDEPDEPSGLVRFGNGLARRGCTTMIAGWDAVVSVVVPTSRVKASRSAALDVEADGGRKFVTYPNKFEGAGWRQGKAALPTPGFRAAMKKAYRVTPGGLAAVDVERDWHDGPT